VVLDVPELSSDVHEVSMITNAIRLAARRGSGPAIMAMAGSLRRPLTPHGPTKVPGGTSSEWHPRDVPSASTAVLPVDSACITALRRGAARFPRQTLLRSSAMAPQSGLAGWEIVTIQQACGNRSVVPARSCIVGVLGLLVPVSTRARLPWTSTCAAPAACRSGFLGLRFTCLDRAGRRPGLPSPVA
jgi:hypothetical protein